MSINLSVLKLHSLFAFIDCPEGFYGLNCSLKCRYPNYGIDCQKDCSQCGQELCNFISGCPTGTVPIPDGNISFNSFNFPINHNILTTLKHPKTSVHRIIIPLCHESLLRTITLSSSLSFTSRSRFLL